jgi:predicted short-subunit dehydrogenase-like oxidoreductase (DUF2520 family)
MNKTVAIIGAGRVGGAIAFLLNRAGYTISSLATRSATSAAKAAAFVGAGEPTTDIVRAASQSGIILITTPDAAIRDISCLIAPAIAAGTLVIHTSGAHTLDLLDAVKDQGAMRAVLHPLQSLPTMEQGVAVLPGSYFRIEADPEALPLARGLVKDLGGIELLMPKWSSDAESAALYHAGAVAVSNYFVALVAYGLKFYEALGADRKETLQAVLPLIKGTLSNIERVGIPEALTGPIVRGDVETIKGHLDAMKKRKPELAGMYAGLAAETIELARERGLSNEKIAEMQQMLKNIV